MLQRYLDPSILANISGLELIAKTVVDGFIAGLHRSPDYGFSQEFAEYRAYSEGDDLRHVDWNVFARTERAYLKRYRGETNTFITMLLDVSASMGYSSQAVSKIDYARYLCASIAYMASQQRDASGIIVFDDEVRNYIPPSSRQGQFARMLHAIESAKLGTRTKLSEPLLHCQQFIHRRGMIAMVSDFYEPVDDIMQAVQPLRAHGNELVLFHVLDPQEVQPVLRDPVLITDMETNEALEISPEYVRNEYRHKIDAHIQELGDKSRANGMDYVFLDTSRPLDAALREYLTIRHGKR